MKIDCFIPINVQTRGFQNVFCNLIVWLKESLTVAKVQKVVNSWRIMANTKYDFKYDPSANYVRILETIFVIVKVTQ